MLRKLTDSIENEINGERKVFITTMKMKQLIGKMEEM